MPVDAFGRQAMTLDELIFALQDAKQSTFPQLGNMPVWVDRRDLFVPVRNVIVRPDGRLILEVHHV